MPQSNIPRSPSRSQLLLRQMLKLTPREIWHRALQLQAGLLTQYWGQNNEAVQVYQVTGGAQPHRIVIKQYPIQPSRYKGLDLDHASWVSCDCANFLYVWEYALAYYGGSDILYGNALPPVYTNPSLIPGVCKHIVMVTIASRSFGSFPPYRGGHKRGRALDTALQEAYAATEIELRRYGLPAEKILRHISERAERLQIKQETLDEFFINIKPKQMALLASLFGEPDYRGRS